MMRRVMSLRPYWDTYFDASKVRKEVYYDITAVGRCQQVKVAARCERKSHD